MDAQWNNPCPCPVRPPISECAPGPNDEWACGPAISALAETVKGARSSVRASAPDSSRRLIEMIPRISLLPVNGMPFHEDRMRATHKQPDFRCQSNGFGRPHPGKTDRSIPGRRRFRSPAFFPGLPFCDIAKSGLPATGGLCTVIRA